MGRKPCAPTDSGDRSFSFSRISKSDRLEKLKPSVIMYRIEYTGEALTDLAYFRTPEQKQILDAVDRQLIHQPTIETNNRKRLRPNRVAEWELRIGKYRFMI